MQPLSPRGREPPPKMATVKSAAPPRSGRSHPLVLVVKWIRVLQRDPDELWGDVAVDARQLLARLQVGPGFERLCVLVSVVATLGLFGLLLRNPPLQCSQGFASEPPQAIRTRW